MRGGWRELLGVAPCSVGFIGVVCAHEHNAAYNQLTVVLKEHCQTKSFKNYICCYRFLRIFVHGMRAAVV